MFVHVHSSIHRDRSSHQNFSGCNQPSPFLPQLYKQTTCKFDGVATDHTYDIFTLAHKCLSVCPPACLLVSYCTLVALESSLCRHVHVPYLRVVLFVMCSSLHFCLFSFSVFLWLGSGQAAPSYCPVSMPTCQPRAGWRDYVRSHSFSEFPKLLELA